VHILVTHLQTFAEWILQSDHDVLTPESPTHIEEASLQVCMVPKRNKPCQALTTHPIQFWHELYHCKHRLGSTRRSSNQTRNICGPPWHQQNSPTQDKQRINGKQMSKVNPIGSPYSINRYPNYAKPSTVNLIGSPPILRTGRYKQQWVANAIGSPPYHNNVKLRSQYQTMGNIHVTQTNQQTNKPTKQTKTKHHHHHHNQKQKLHINIYEPTYPDTYIHIRQQAN
jgi:hypothetical protein